MIRFVFLATLVVQTSTGQSTVWDNLSDKACAESASAVNRGLTVQEAADLDARRAEQEARLQAEWERANPKIAKECADQKTQGIWSSGCDYRGVQVLGSTGSYSVTPFVKWARCVK